MRNFLSSTVGKKYIMGVTGLIWAGFVLAHMSGNLLMFISPDAYNAYGHALTSGKFIYVAEAVLILAFLSHVYCAISLTIQNRQAKGSQYAVVASGAKKVTPASRMMAVQGSFILAFIIMHIATFKYGTHYETTVDGVVMRDLFKLIVEVFKQPGYVAWYVVSLVLLGFHLSHGFKSSFQSLGLLLRNNEAMIKKVSCLYAILVAAGFLAQPIYVLFFVN